MSDLEIRKQVSIFMPVSDWRLIRDEAARRRIPITELCRRWMKSELGSLRRRRVPPEQPERDNPQRSEVVASQPCR